MAAGPKITVSSLSFSKSPELRALLQHVFRDVKFCQSLDILKDEALAEFFKDAEGVIVGAEKVDGRLLSACPQLKVVSKYGVGLDNIDLEACQKAGITVGFTAGVNKRAVAEETLGFMIALLRNLYLTSNLLKQGQWFKSGGTELSNKTVGIVGFGNIGTELARLLAPFRCKLLVNDSVDKTPACQELDARQVELDELLRDSDLVSLHVPLTEVTRSFFNAEKFAQMKPGAFFINTSRGAVVDEAALKAALDNQHLAGAALDVYCVEPLQDLSLVENPRVISTPHIGGNAKEAVLAMGSSAIEHLKSFFKTGL